MHIDLLGSDIQMIFGNDIHMHIDLLGSDIQMIFGNDIHMNIDLLGSDIHMHIDLLGKFNATLFLIHVSQIYRNRKTGLQGTL